MSDNLIVRLKDGVVERQKRWQGDTHDDLGGWVDYEATDSLMAEAAAALAAKDAEIARLREAAMAVIARWDSADWKAPPTADVMNRLRAALSTAAQTPPE